MVEVKEGVLVGVSSSEWQDMLVKNCYKILLLIFGKNLLLGKKDMKIIIKELDILGRKI